MADIIQKATEWDKQSTTFKKTRPLGTLHQTHWMQPKYDGCHLIIDTTAQRAFSRTNETVRSLDHLVAQAVKGFGPGWIVQGEAWMEATPFPFISGKYRQHAAWPDMLYMAYDCLPVADFQRGLCEYTYSQRFDWLQERGLWAGYTPDILLADTSVALGTDVQARANELVALGGYDGLILRRPEALWVAGPCRMGEIVKVKPNVSLDLRCVGWASKPGDKTGREVVTITVEYRGAETSVGSGVPHDITPDNAHRLLGQIVEVGAMSVNPNNTLREPRYKGVRYDKKEPDA